MERADGCSEYADLHTYALMRTRRDDVLSILARGSVTLPDDVVNHIVSAMGDSHMPDSVHGIIDLLVFEPICANIKYAYDDETDESDVALGDVLPKDVFSTCALRIPSCYIHHLGVENWARLYMNQSIRTLAPVPAHVATGRVTLVRTSMKDRIRVTAVSRTGFDVLPWRNTNDAGDQLYTAAELILGAVGDDHVLVFHGTTYTDAMSVSTWPEHDASSSKFDFGRGLYVTTNPGQAGSWSVSKAVFDDPAVVVWKIPRHMLPDLDVAGTQDVLKLHCHVFVDDGEFLEHALAWRTFKRETLQHHVRTWEAFDVLCGPVATCERRWDASSIRVWGRATAESMEANPLNQLAFRTAAARDALHSCDACIVVIRNTDSTRVRNDGEGGGAGGGGGGGGGGCM